MKRRQIIIREAAAHPSALSRCLVTSQDRRACLIYAIAAGSY
jgi:hypothetical protein